nr:redoxin domain-containing protein [Ammoniphilus sp. YIM 78166]
MPSLYGISVKNTKGEDIPLSDYKDKVLLIVNVASRCGYTSQYQDLQMLHERYHDEGLVILGFPSDDFNQELDTIEEVVEFCSVNYGVEFPLFDFIHVKGGDNQHPLYQWLTSHSGRDVKWNFEKFLVSRDGSLKEHFESSTNPQSTEVINQVEQLLLDK